MAPKRKRASASAAEETEETASTDLETTNGAIPVAERMFNVQVYRENRPLPKKPRSGDWSEILEQDGWRPEDKAIKYRVSPGAQWDGMKKYKNFVVSNKTFGNGDFVFIYHGSEAQGANLDPAKSDSWVAKVLEIRAQDPSHVYLRILWLYWPDELPSTGKLDYHAANELIASNSMEIMDAMTVTDRAEVTFIKEEYTEQPAEGLFWRQKFDCLTNTLSDLRTDCKCGGPHNPEKKLIYCGDCRSWLHEICLLNDALDRFMWKKNKSAREEDAEGGEGSTLVEAPDTITVDDKAKVKKQPARRKSTPKARRKSRKSSLSATNVVVKPDWEGKLVARLEMRTNEAGEETDDATGKVIITDLDANGDGESENFKEELRCLCCNAALALTEEPASL